MWGLFKPKNDNQVDISFFDVKELYDAAYEEKAKARVNLRKYQALIKRAEKMDVFYRQQLALTKAARYMEAA